MAEGGTALCRGKERAVFQLTNEQRACLGLTIVEPGWEWVQLKNSPYDTGFETWACFDGPVIRKAVQVGPDSYQESAYCEKTAEDRTLLLPRTARGKPKKLSAVTLTERRPLGMRFSWSGERGFISLVNLDTERTYYSNVYETERPKTFSDFTAWLDCWSAETTPEDMAALAGFLREKRQHVKFREGDFFRFSVGRRQYGYGRVLLDFYRLSKCQPCWNILMTRPVIVKVYHLITDDPSLPVEELRKLPALPSQYMMDNDLYYGEFPIVGNLPLEDSELDFPIMYGASISALDFGKKKVLLQCGPLFRELEEAEIPEGCGGFRNNGIGGLHMDRADWEACIAAGSNAPLWDKTPERYYLRCDLRNPAYREQLKRVCAQFGLRPEDLHIC